MRTAVLAAALAIAASGAAEAQSFSGTWQAATPNGTTITLALRQTGRQVTGTLSGNGNTFQVSGQVGADGELTGTVTSQMGTMYIAAESEGAQLAMVLAEMGADNQPNLSAAQQVNMTRVSGQAGAAPMAPQQAGPMGGAPQGGGGRDPFVGTFSNAEVSVTIQGSAGHYQGHATYQGSQYPLQAQGQGNRLQGVYVANGQQYTFEAMVQGDLMQLSTDGQTLQLQRGTMAAGRGPAPGAQGGAPGPQGGGGGGNLAATPQDRQIAQILLSSPWCYMRYSQTLGTTSTERVVFSQDGRVVQSTGRETSMSNQYGNLYGNSSGGDQGMWRVQNGNLMLSANGAQWEAVPLQITRNSNGYPIVTAGGKEYSQCR